MDGYDEELSFASHFRLLHRIFLQKVLMKAKERSKKEKKKRKNEKKRIVVFGEMILDGANREWEEIKMKGK